MTTMPSKPGVTRKCHCFEPTNSPSWCDRPSVWAHRVRLSSGTSLMHNEEEWAATLHLAGAMLHLLPLYRLHRCSTEGCNNNPDLFMLQLVLWSNVCFHTGNLKASDGRLRSEETHSEFNGLKKIYSKPATGCGQHRKQKYCDKIAKLKVAQWKHDNFFLGARRWRGTLI